MNESLRDRFAAILRMHFAADDPGSMSAVAARDGEPLVDEDWLLVADELLAASPPEPAKLPAGHPDTWPGGTMHMAAPDPGIDAALDEQDRGAASVARDLRLAAALVRTPETLDATDVYATAMLGAWRKTKDFLRDRLLTSGRSDVSINAVLRVMNEALNEPDRGTPETETA